MKHEINEQLVKYVPVSKREAILSIYHDEDGYWIYLNDGWNADRMDQNCQTIHEDTIKDLRYQIGGISKVDNMSEELKAKKKEALERMKMLRLHKNAVKEFEKEDVLNLSEGIGALYWLNDDEKKIVKEFEEYYDKLVYHVIKSHTNLGIMYSLLYVSSFEEEWEFDRDDITNDCTFAYVYNASMPDCSEFGTIGFRRSIGGLVRTW